MSLERAFVIFCKSKDRFAQKPGLMAHPSGFEPETVRLEGVGLRKRIKPIPHSFQSFTKIEQETNALKSSRKEMRGDGASKSVCKEFVKRSWLWTRQSLAVHRAGQVRSPVLNQFYQQVAL